ncbi:MAG: hypothetical protein IKW05_05660 [Muribaculaceae bacterium]|nr:hypothetical protein [Bacteroidales bacterium]MBR5241405.1 hypothetical protein [Muribaculaceae bacterium]MBR5533061.1 hypothetical protein [Bacteroidales bacterium]
MGKKNVVTENVMSKEKREILELCYSRLRELIPECSNEVTLIKCIEILEKHENSNVSQDEGQRTLLAIASTLERLSEVK